MTQKRKPESNSLVDTFFDTVLFSKRYRFETSVPADVAVARLHDLSSEMHGWLYRKPRYVVTSKPMMDYERIDIRAKDTRQPYTIAHASGTVHTGMHSTVVEGEIRFGVAYLFLLLVPILWVFFIFQFVAFYVPLWVIALAMVAPVYNFGQMIYQRNKLLGKIQTAITPRISDRHIVKSKVRHLSDREMASYDEFPEFEDEQSHYSRR